LQALKLGQRLVASRGGAILTSMVRDAFGLFRGWCRDRPSCLEYRLGGAPSSPDDAQAGRCTACGCLPQQHVPTLAAGYDPHSAEQVASRSLYDASLLPPDERAARHKASADAAYCSHNFRSAYEGYTEALEATPSDAVLLANRCQAYLRVGRPALAREDAASAVRLRPDWAKAHYRLGSCLTRLEEHAGAIAAFERACALEPAAADSRKALEEARRAAKAARRLEAELEAARLATTERQAQELKADAEMAARRHAHATGAIADLGAWHGPAREAWEAAYEATKRPPANVECLLLEARPAEEEEEEEEEEAAARGAEEQQQQAEVGGEGGGEGGGEIGSVEGTSGAVALTSEIVDLVALLQRTGLLHELRRAEVLCAEVGGGEAPFGGEAVRSVDDLDRLGATQAFIAKLGYADDAKGVRLEALIGGREPLRPPPAGRGGGGQGTLALAPRNYALVHEDGTVHKKDNFEPMSMGMQRVHYEAAPEPVWVQTPTCRWMQTAAEITLIAHTVPAHLCRAAELCVEIWPFQVAVAARRGGERFVFGETERRLDPAGSTWATDGTTVTLTLAKANLELMGGAHDKGAAPDAHWARLFTADQFVEHGMVDADCSALPAPMLERRRWREAQHRHEQEALKQKNACPLCGKDVRAFCRCRDGLVEYADYEMPLPSGWKDGGWSTDGFGEYDMGSAGQLQPRDPPQPAPYQGGRSGTA